jgi:crossover junction endodeoxyribonuclease RusA
MPEHITIVLTLPTKELSPNWRGHWAQKSRAVREYRSQAYAAGIAASKHNKPMWKTAIAQATFFHLTRHRRDGDNLLASLKAAFDGIADAGIVANDSGITHRPVVQLIDTETPRVQIVIEP